jgi:ABC-type nitrate/sulfonate/bicarbonate transport system permease component
MKKWMSLVAFPAVGLALVVGVWQAIIVWGHVQPYIAPRPAAAIGAIFSHWSEIWPLTATTISETLYGFASGAIVGFLLALAMAKIPVINKMLYPLLVFSQAIPVIALAPPLVLIFAFSLTPKILVVAWIVFFPVTVAVVDGLANIDRDYLTLATVLGARPWRTFLFIEVPAIVTPLFSGLRIGATYAVTGAIIGEAATGGGATLAQYQHDAATNFQTQVVYGTTIVMAAIGIGSFAVVSTIHYAVTPWLRRSTIRRRVA